ncbi:PREDICTED: regulatory-associated protein of mTOR-like [Acropora digitifera]|uniref:regulatory-associated protein of mTOR-like n=1 Tax=Acropora digitifera TaxID=70779 RepID=UPI00077AD942|nr:PREDICTED: regulatory-associated protein of mTOR-like [Acropora digitifera]
MSSEELEHDDSFFDEDEGEIVDWQLPLCFMKKRHKEVIEGSRPLAQTWRMKERMKTVSVALVLCLNIGVDPPDVVKTSPCARMECWIDPLSTSSQKALETVGNKLQEQYERWQPRARYKQSLDPTVEEVKKLCTSLRRNAKEERVLFHYNGHGVPRATANGEIWVFNKSYTQYIPLSVYDLQTWMGSPSIFVYDCNNAGLIVQSFIQFATQREQEQERCLSQGNPMPVPLAVKNCIQLASCGANQLLPMNPELPADLFTSCLSTPIKVALRWSCSQKSSKLVPNVTLELIEKIPGRLNDRRTPLGELNWIFTAVTDTIAWNTLPRDLFHKLFRQDLLVASLFRNFLLAERVMRSYNCTPISHPRLPPTYMHPMWQAWDLAVDICLSQLPDVTENPGNFKHSPFFTEQLTAFQVWLAMGAENRDPPEQLPIVLQVLLSQVHRLRALDLLGRFLDLGPWAVNLALSVGIFAYVLKLLQSSARELRPLLVFIWAKILAVDSSCQADLVKDNGHKYFLSVLADVYTPAEHRTMAAFVLSVIVNEYLIGQEACVQGNIIAICLEQLTDPHPLLRQWLAICLGRVWSNYEAARWCAVRDSAPDKLYCLLADPLPEVRAAAVFALGRFIANTGDRSDQANQIDFGVAVTLTQMSLDGSPLVRKELVVALYGLVVQFETNFGVVALQFLEEDRQKENGPSAAAITSSGWIVVGPGQPPGVEAGAHTNPSSGGKNPRGLRASFSSSHPNAFGSNHPVVSGQHMSPAPFLAYSSSGGSSSGNDFFTGVKDGSNLRRSSSQTSISGFQTNVYGNVWKALLNLSVDPFVGVAEIAKQIVNGVTLKATFTACPQKITSGSGLSSSTSTPSSPGRFGYLAGSDQSLTPPPSQLSGSNEALRAMKMDPLQHRASASGALGPGGYPHSYEFHTKRKMFDKGPERTKQPSSASEDNDQDSDEEAGAVKHPVIRTNFAEWCASYFAQSVMKLPEEHDPQSKLHLEREWRFERNSKVRREAAKQQAKPASGKIDDQIFINKNLSAPGVLRFHPYEPYLAVSDRGGVSVWNWEKGVRINYISNNNPKISRITSMDFLNAHDLTLLLTGTDDGSVRVWRNIEGENYSDKSLEMVTAWQALSGMLPSTRGSGSGLVISWEQETGNLLASGDVRFIRVWDTQREMRMQDIPTGADSCVTSLACDSVGRSLLIAGCGDGSVRLFDRRLPPSDSRVMALREHTGWVTSVFLQKGGEGNIISGSVSGDVKFWDPRFSESVRNLETISNSAAFEVHHQANVFATGSTSQVIKVYSLNGENLSTIRYHDGFMGQRIGPISCLAFHPHRVHLAAGSTDSFISIYSTEKKRHGGLSSGNRKIYHEFSRI